ncbi:MAG: lipase family protein [Pirellulaceae bacterium]
MHNYRPKVIAFLFLVACCATFLTPKSFAQQSVGQADPIYSLPAQTRLAEPWRGNESVDWGLSASLALISKTAYDDDAELMKLIAKGMGFDDCLVFRNNNSVAHAFIGEKAIVFAFRGTEFTSLADWKTDAYIRTITDPSVGGLHSGFNTAYEDVRRNVELVIRTNPNKAIWVTGHSLGGAMAVICAIRCKQTKLADLRIMTFGQPRVGNNSTARWIDKYFSNTYQRFVNDQDLVPRLPPARYFQYADAGKFIIIGQQRAYGAVAGSAGGENEKVVLNVAAPRVTTTWAPHSGLPPQNQPYNDLNQVYQSRGASLPITEVELDQLIQEETNLNEQANRLSPFFPGSEGSPPLQARNAGGTPSVRNFIGTDKFTDHKITGYLQHIRKSRDE